MSLKGFFSSKSDPASNSATFKTGAVYHVKYLSLVPYVSTSNGLMYGTSAVVKFPWSLVQENAEKTLSHLRSSVIQSQHLKKLEYLVKKPQEKTEISQSVIGNQKKPVSAAHEAIPKKTGGGASRNPKELGHSDGLKIKMEPKICNERRFLGFGVKTELSLGSLIKRPVNKFRAVCWYESTEHGVSLE